MTIRLSPRKYLTASGFILTMCIVIGGAVYMSHKREDNVVSLWAMLQGTAWQDLEINPRRGGYVNFFVDPKEGPSFQRSMAGNGLNVTGAYGGIVHTERLVVTFEPRYQYDEMSAIDLMRVTATDLLPDRFRKYFMKSDIEKMPMEMKEQYQYDPKNGILFDLLTKGHRLSPLHPEAKRQSGH
jgi:hypothetical protein